MSPLLQTLLQQAEHLTAAEQLELISLLADQLRRQTDPPQTKRKWGDLRGMAPYPLMGKDAQEWVSQTRREGVF